MPVYNAAGTVETAIRSILRQTVHDFELIIYDDGSTDDSVACARAAAAGDKRVHIEAGPHVGIVEALQRGCALANGDYLARMDADDDMEPVRFERQLAYMASDPEIAICGTSVRMVGAHVGPGRRRYERWINRLTTHHAIMNELFVECPIPHPTFMMRRKVFETIGGYQERGWAEDYDCCMRAALAGYRFVKAPERLVHWRESPMRLSMNDERYSPSRFRALKRHYLFQIHPLAGRRLVQWGAGSVGKPWLREWNDPRPTAVVDINPRKIGEMIHRVPVVTPEELPAPEQGFIVVAVGTEGARDEIRSWMLPRGYQERKDFIFVA